MRQTAPPTFYVPYKQGRDLRHPTFEVKSAASEGSMAGAGREVIRPIDKYLPVVDFRTQTQQIEATLSHERVFAALTAGFGVLALVLACIGIYGVMAYSVVRRTSEIGLRMALGAENKGVLTMILRETSLLALIGVVLGVLVMAAVALLAGWWPARQASRLDPMTALRHE